MIILLLENGVVASALYLHFSHVRCYKKKKNERSQNHNFQQSLLPTTRLIMHTSLN